MKRPKYIYIYTCIYRYIDVDIIAWMKGTMT